MSTREMTSPPSAGRLLSKVPEITIWFWVIKILCTTVGESFADFINVALGVGLVATAVIFAVVTEPSPSTASSPGPAKPSTGSLFW